MLYNQPIPNAVSWLERQQIKPNKLPPGFIDKNNAFQTSTPIIGQRMCNVFGKQYKPNTTEGYRKPNRQKHNMKIKLMRDYFKT